MADPAKMSDADLQAAAEELSRRQAEASNVAKAAFLDTIKPLIEAGFGGTKKVTIAEVIAALEATRAIVPREWFAPIDAALTGMQLVNDRVANATTETTPVPAPPTPAAP